MWATIGSIIIKYWVEFLLGLVVAGGGFLLKRFFKLEREERKREQDEHFKILMKDFSEENQKIITTLQQDNKNIHATIIAVQQESQHDDQTLQQQVSQLNTDLSGIKAGMLSVQGKEFRANCRKLLAEDHEITLDEWEEIDKDHEAYNGLGGNHRGDQLYALVKKKAEHFLTDN